MIVVGERLHPAISCLDGEAAGKALGGEHLVPVSLTVGLAVLEEEGAVAKELATVGAGEALRMELLADGVQAVSLRDRIDSC